VRGYIGNTDYDWYSYLSSLPDIDEVNFWQPSASSGFRGEPGTPFFFRLKSPYNAIAGFGYVASYSRLPAWLAWEAFGPKNGARSLPEVRERIERYRRRNAVTLREGDYEIGCIMVTTPTFFPPGSWVREPRGWQPNIVRGRYEDIVHGEGLRIFAECLERAAGLGANQPAEAYLAAESALRYGKPIEIRPRLGQGTFRVAVLDAYDRACAITGEHSLPVLEAAHVKPFASGGEHALSNGIALRSDIHRLFDLGYVTVTPDYGFKVSEALRDDYQNGRTYYDMQNRQLLHLPAERLRPKQELLAWHGETVFRR